MASLDEVFVADGVSHAYNLHPSNYKVDRFAETVVEHSFALEQSMPPEYQRTRDSFVRNWPAEDTANILFGESHVDFGVFHPQPVTLFEDGLTANAKARRFAEAHPDRSATMASIDAIGMDDPEGELTSQVEDFDPHGVKVYPSYWDGDRFQHFRMDNASLAFPLWEHAVDLGLDVVAVHKALPLGGAPMNANRVEDLDQAAASFPELTFEIVHGGLAFAEETGWQLARYPNVYVNLEKTLIQAVFSPESFVDAMEDLLWVGGKAATDKILWGSGAPHLHPQLMLEAFWEFDFPEMNAMGGKYQITEADKRKMVGENLAEAHNFDIENLKRNLPDDEFSRSDEPADPYSLSSFEVAG
jgi:predicted TIM-barrel fold metal-dependent hydrolase